MNYKPLWFSTIFVFITILFSLLYTTNFDVGINQMMKFISFLLIPLLFSFFELHELQSIYSFVKKGLITGVLTVLVLLIIFNLYKFLVINNETRFLDIFNYSYTRTNFTSLFKIHPTYLGTYIIFSTVLLIKDLFLKKRNILLFYSSLLVMLLGIIFVNSRIVFLIYLFIVLTSVIFLLRTIFIKKLYIRLTILLFTILALFIFSFFQIKKTYIYYRFTKELQWEFSDDINSFYTYKKESISDPRLARLKCALEVIKERPIFGYGIGSETNVLIEKYKSKNMISSYNKRYDAHNQYLSYLIVSGVFGVLLFLFYMFSNSFIAFKNGNIEYFALIIIISVVCLVDNYLNRSRGITFFTFFSNLYLFMTYKKLEYLK